MAEGNPKAAVIARNALRREAKLPLLDEDAEVERALDRDRRKVVGEFLDRHSSLLAEFRRRVLAEYEERNGRRPATGFGWWGVHLRAQRRFEAEVERRLEVSREG